MNLSPINPSDEFLRHAADCQQMAKFHARPREQATTGAGWRSGGCIVPKCFRASAMAQQAAPSQSTGAAPRSATAEILKTDGVKADGAHAAGPRSFLPATPAGAGLDGEQVAASAVVRSSGVYGSAGSRTGRRTSPASRRSHPGRSYREYGQSRLAGRNAASRARRPSRVLLQTDVGEQQVHIRTFLDHGRACSAVPAVSVSWPSSWTMASAKTRTCSSSSTMRTTTMAPALLCTLAQPTERST